MSMKGIPPLPPLPIRNAATNAKTRDPQAPIKNQATSKKSTMETPIKNSVQRKYNK